MINHLMGANLYKHRKLKGGLFQTKRLEVKLIDVEKKMSVSSESNPSKEEKVSNGIKVKEALNNLHELAESS